MKDIIIDTNKIKPIKDYVSAKERITLTEAQATYLKELAITAQELTLKKIKFQMSFLENKHSIINKNIHALQKGRYI